MPKGPPVTEIFSPLMKTQNSHFRFRNEDKGPTELAKKKNFAPLPPMQKFGGYKPKIFGDRGNEIIPLSSESTPAPSNRTEASVTASTKAKPLIIGDKDMPMTLGILDNTASNNYNLNAKMEDMHIYEEPQMYNEINEMNNNNISNLNKNIILSREQQPSCGGLFKSDSEGSLTGRHDEGFTVSDEEEGLIGNKKHTQKSKFATENPVFSDMDTEDSGVEPETEVLDGVFIPPPDYEEGEQSLMFGEEDPDELIALARQKEEERRRVQKMRQQRRDGPGPTIYDGEDLSKYLTDDDEDDSDEEIKYAQFAKKQQQSKTKDKPIRLQEKHSLFKTKQHNTTGKQNKYKKNKNAPVFNSVRNFSFADSKYSGTLSRGSGSGSKNNLADSDHESFLVTSQRGEGYETFLKSKHGVEDESRIPSVALPHSNKGNANIFKKMTVRLRHKLQGNDYDLQAY